MAEFKIIYYIILVMSFLLIAVFLWGAVTYKRSKTKVKFLNRPLLAVTLAVAAISFILAWVPIGMQVWDYDDVLIRSDAGFISVLVLECLFLVAFLGLAYMFAFDFGIAVEADTNKLQFFGQAVNIDKIVDLETKGHSLKIVYEQGFKNIKKKVTIFTPKAKLFVKEALTEIVANNQNKRAAQHALANAEASEATHSGDTESNS